VPPDAGTATAHCVRRCDWTAEGTWEAADRAAGAHTRKTGHPTATVAVPPAGKALDPHRPARAAEGAQEALP
jgi:hypothetical protein